VPALIAAEGFALAAVIGLDGLPVWQGIRVLVMVLLVWQVRAERISAFLVKRQLGAPSS
jgi:hypothetical protein